MPTFVRPNSEGVAVDDSNLRETWSDAARAASAAARKALRAGKSKAEAIGVARKVFLSKNKSSSPGGRYKDDIKLGAPAVDVKRGGKSTTAGAEGWSRVYKGVENRLKTGKTTYSKDTARRAARFKGIVKAGWSDATRKASAAARTRHDPLSTVHYGKKFTVEDIYRLAGGRQNLARKMYRDTIRFQPGALKAHGGPKGLMSAIKRELG